MIGCHEVSVEIGAVAILDRVSLAVADGGWLGIIGPNGAGKSTLLRVLAGRQDHGGTVTVSAPSDPDTEGLRLDRRARSQRIAYLEQTPVVPPGMFVADYVMLGRTPHLSRFGIESDRDRDVVRRVIEELDLAPLAGRRLDTLSGGERQRALIGRALAQEAPVVLLDEPTTSLDLGHQQEVLELLDRLRLSEKLTLVSTMHDLTLASQFPLELLLLDQGRVVATGSSDEVLTTELITRHYGARVKVDNGHVRPLR